MEFCTGERKSHRCVSNSSSIDRLLKLVGSTELTGRAVVGKEAAIGCGRHRKLPRADAAAAAKAALLP